MRNIATKDDTKTLSASDYNANEDELENFVTNTDQSLDPAGGPDTNLTMMGRTAAAYANAGAVYQDSGAANAYVLALASNLKSVFKYYTGLQVTFKVGNSSTGASTVNVAALGVKSITLPDGTALSIGDLIIGTYATLVYNLGDDRFEVVSVVVPQKEVVSESKNLVLELLNTIQVQVDFERLSLLDSNFVPKYLNNISTIFAMPGDLMAGTTEKSSHWYQMWLDSAGTRRLVPDLTGTTDGTTAGFLVDSGNTFDSDLLIAGAVVRNRTTGLQTTVETTPTVDGANLKIIDDIFTSSDEYEIRMLTIEGLGDNKSLIGQVFNDGSSDFTEVEKYGSARITTAFYENGNGWGSVNNKINKYLNEIEASDDIVVTVANSATDGFSITANMDCMLHSHIVGDYSAGQLFGFSLNSTQLTTALNTITSADILAITTSTASNPMAVGIEKRLKKGDIVRPHDGGAGAFNTSLNRIIIVATEIT